MTRRTVVTGLLGILFLPLAAGAQPLAKPARVGVIGERGPADPFLDALRKGLRDLGYVDGRDILVEYRYAEGKIDRVAALTVELVRRGVDVIVVGGTGSAHAAKSVTSTVPIVFVLPGDPVGTGLVASLARPGGNMTGIYAAS